MTTPPLVDSATATPRATSRGARTVLPGQAPDGSYILSVLVKRTFDIVPGAACVLAEDDTPLFGGDVFWDDPMTSSVRFESDFVPFKLATDVVLNATAFAPGGSPTTACVASVRVGDAAQTIQIVGDRVARYVDGGTPTFTEPTPFTSMPVRYERAYGGTDVYSDVKVPYPYPRNPLGRGFAVRNALRAVDGLVLPNVESPASPLTPDTLCLGEYGAWTTRPVPAGFGWITKTWLPRAELAGIMPADRGVERELRQAYAKLLPADQREAYLKHGIRDMDFAFFNGASPGLIRPYLTGGEWVIADNLTADGQLRFQLAEGSPRIGLDIGEGVQEPNVVLQTVMIRLDERLVDLVWRGAVPYRGPDWLPEMKQMDVLVE